MARSLRTGTDVERPENLGHVVFHRAFADAERAGNQFVAQALAQQGAYFFEARREGNVWRRALLDDGV